MSETDRTSFLRRVREAVAQGNRAGTVPELEERGAVGYQGAGADPVQRFCAELAAAGGVAYVVADRQAAVTRVLELADRKSTGKILLGRGPFLDPLSLAELLRQGGREVVLADELSQSGKEEFFAAELGISGAAYLVAETGTVVVAARLDDPRSVSLLPPIHIVVAGRQQLLPDLFDLFQAYQEAGLEALPSGLALITGPSKTGDIELKLVTGVHGPGEVHVVLIQ